MSEVVVTVRNLSILHRGTAQSLVLADIGAAKAFSMSNLFHCCIDLVLSLLVIRG